MAPAALDLQRLWDGGPSYEVPCGSKIGSPFGWRSARASPRTLAAYRLRRCDRPSVVEEHCLGLQWMARCQRRPRWISAFCLAKKSQWFRPDTSVSNHEPSCARHQRIFCQYPLGSLGSVPGRARILMGKDERDGGKSCPGAGPVCRRARKLSDSPWKRGSTANIDRSIPLIQDENERCGSGIPMKGAAVLSDIGEKCESRSNSGRPNDRLRHIRLRVGMPRQRIGCSASRRYADPAKLAASRRRSRIHLSQPR